MYSSLSRLYKYNLSKPEYYVYLQKEKKINKKKKNIFYLFFIVTKNNFNPCSKLELTLTLQFFLSGGIKI